MSDIKSFRDLLVWQKSMDLAVRCYRAAQGLPRSEQQVLGYQLRKSSVSMPSNVAEGFAEVGRMINGLVKSLERVEHPRSR